MPARPHSLPALPFLALLATTALAACSYTEAKPDAASRTTAPPPVDVRSEPVVGALPPITVATSLPVAPAGAADDAAPLPGGDPAVVPDEQAPADTAPPDTQPPASAQPAAAPPAPAPATGTRVALQVGSFSAVDGANRLTEQLRDAGFEGFSTQGSGPFRVLRGGLSEADATSLRQRLAAAGFESFVVRA